MANLNRFSIYFFLLLFCVTSSALAKKSKDPKFVVKDGYKSIVYGGLVYKGSIAVSEKAFERVHYVVDAMLEKVPYVRTRMIEVGYKIVIVAKDQKLTDVPEYAFFKGKTSHQRVINVHRSFDTDVPGMSEYELCVVGEQYLFNTSGDDVIAHEMAHAILYHMYREDADLILRIYKKAFEKRLFPTSKYLMNNYQEYWAVLSTAWLGLGKNYRGNNGVDSAEKVKAVDPKIAEFLEQIYGNRTLDPAVSDK